MLRNGYTILVHFPANTHTMIRLHTCLFTFLCFIIFLNGNAQESEVAQNEPPRTNEASRDNSDVWLVVIMCLLFCFALRHMNDFYVGESVTLVAEGEFTHRFSRRQTNKHLERVEKDFNDMFQKLCEKYERDLDSDGCCGYYEEKKPVEKVL